MKAILYEDDCAPDAREFFDKDMKKLTGMTIEEFQKVATLSKRDSGMIMSWKYKHFMLEYSGYDPHLYTLYLKEVKANGL